MKKIISLLLAILMLACTLTTFAGCALFKIKVDMTDFSVFYTSTRNTTATFKSSVIDFCDELKNCTGVKIKTAKQIQQGQKLILIGETEHEESVKAYESIKGDGFAIRVSKDVIAIVGTSQLMTMYALQYFEEEYLADIGTPSTTLSLPRKVKQSKMPVAELVNSEGSEFSFVYEASLDTTKGCQWTEAYNNCHYDYPYDMLLACQDALASQVKLRNDLIKKQSDETDAQANEILVGMPDRAEITECLADLPDDHAGVFVRNGKVLVTSHSDSSLTEAKDIFLDLVKDGTVTDEDGTVSVRFPEGLSISTQCFEDFVTDFPKPEGLTLYNMQDAGDMSLQYLYMGEGVNADAFHAYDKVLQSSGYTLLCENEIEQSLFATYVNHNKNTTLYVTYNAFIHGKDNYDYEPRLKVISASLENVTLPDVDILRAPYIKQKKVDSTITAVPLENKDVGMGYVIMLEDGRFVIFDGGFDENAKNATKLWEILTSLQARQTAGTDGTIRIAAWVLTHSHADHYEVFQEFLTKYLKTGQAKLEYILGNYPSEIVTDNAGGRDMVLYNTIKNIAQGLNGCKFIKIHTGQRYYFSNLEIEVLYTQEDANPIRYDLFNDTSCTLRFTMQATDAQGNAVSNKEATVTAIWTGDTFIYGSRFMTAMYGPDLKADMVQVAHHGNVGCESPLYDNIDPTLIWFPHTYALFQSYTKYPSPNWQSTVDRKLAFEGNVKYAFVSDGACVTIALRTTGPDYDGVFDALTGEVIPYFNYKNNSENGVLVPIR